MSTVTSVVCAWCGVLLSGSNAAPEEQTSHGICAPCKRHLLTGEGDTPEFRRRYAPAWWRRVDGRVVGALAGAAAAALFAWIVLR